MTKLKLVEDASKVWKYGCMQMQYLAMVLGTIWAGLPEDVRRGFLESLGLTPLQFYLASIALSASATYFARIVEKAPAQVEDREPPRSDFPPDEGFGL